MDKDRDKEIDKIIEKVRKDEEVIAVALFGSSLKGNGRDIDVCLFLREKRDNLFMSRKKLEYAKEVGDGIDVSIFQQLPVFIRIRILKEGRVLFVRDESLLYEIAFSTIKEFDFYEKIYNMYLGNVKGG